MTTVRARTILASMIESPTAFTARIIGLRAPTEPTSEPSCWLCAGDLDGQGVPLADVIGAAFTDHPRRHQSTHVCLGCAATVKVAEFQRVVSERGMGLKIWAQAGFNSYSHFVAEPDVYECPKPARIREILLDPPMVPWLLAINETGQKPTLAKAQVNGGGADYAVVMADDLLWTSKTEFAACLADFERMSELGFAKDDTITGRLHPESLRKAGIAGIEADRAMRRWRSSAPHLLALVAFAARSRVFFIDQKRGRPRDPRLRYHRRARRHGRAARLRHVPLPQPDPLQGVGGHVG
ncbi:hypothetical protein [Aureimonas sp. Leaf324]|uniref:hypothetical protein n=1 Tax=Aureimonas sp. Leaf324 TaxID=1736336 RepID=UPI0012E2108E|nr:hypothetical protein [Aureimonas sp. Leaf324]